jgi:hypothetical protein
MNEAIKMLVDKVGITEAQATKAAEVLKGIFGNFTGKAAAVADEVADKAESLKDKGITGKLKDFFGGSNVTK